MTDLLSHPASASAQKHDSTPVRRANMLRDAIAQEIATGTIQPGEHLDEVAMARRFGVSRTPIREALQQSEAESQIHETRIAQPAIFAIQVGLTALWRRNPTWC